MERIGGFFRGFSVYFMGSLDIQNPPVIPVQCDFQEPPIMGHSRTISIRIPKDMGMIMGLVWEAYHKGCPSEKVFGTSKKKPSQETFQVSNTSSSKRSLDV